MTTDLVETKGKYMKLASFCEKDISTTGRYKLTMEQMLCQCVIGHVLGNKQSFVTFTAATKQICKSFAPELANRLGFFLKAQKDSPGERSLVAESKEAFYCRQKGRIDIIRGFPFGSKVSRCGY